MQPSWSKPPFSRWFVLFNFRVRLAFAFTTLRIRRPVGRILVQTAPLLLLLFLLSEGVLRLDFVQQRLATSRMGSRHSQLGEKLRLLEAVIVAEGQLDCVVLGSSVVDNGFDPRAFSRAYEQITGQEITCFNFGIDAIPGATAGVLAEILVQDYQPRVLIYGVDARDLAVARDAPDTTVVLDSPWIQYRAGRLNLQGWLLEHSYLKRYATQLKQLLVFDYESALWKPQENLTALGYNALYEVATPDEHSFQVTVLTDLFSDFEVPPENLEGLAQILQLDNNGTHVFVVMMPVADGYYSFYNNGQAEYDAFVNQLEDIVMRGHVPFLRPNPNRLIPADGWYDYMHVNATGADVLSSWLGVQVSTALKGKN